MIAHEWGSAGEADEALTAFVGRTGEEDPYQVAQAYAWTADADHAFAFLERARERHVGSLNHIKWDWWFKKVRSDPRYAALLQKMNLPLD